MHDAIMLVVIFFAFFKKISKRPDNLLSYIEASETGTEPETS
jgi:hypothetical protein